MAAGILSDVAKVVDAPERSVGGSEVPVTADMPFLFDCVHVVNDMAEKIGVVTAVRAGSFGVGFGLGGKLIGSVNGPVHAVTIFELNEARTLFDLFLGGTSFGNGGGDKDNAGNDLEH